MHLDRNHVDELKAGVERIVEDRGLASCQYALALDGEVLVSETIGAASADSRYRIFSSTKILAVSVIWQLIGEGQLDPSLTVASWWPEFGQHGKERITLEHVLAHSAGVTNGVVDEAAFDDRDARIEQIAGWALEWEPGTRFEYHGLSAHWILAELITRVTGGDHRQVIRERLLDPLGLTRLELGVPIERQGDVLPMAAAGSPATEEDMATIIDPALAKVVAPFLSQVPAVPEDDPFLGPLISPAALAAGIPGASAVSDAASLALLYQALLSNGKGLWEPKTLEHATHTIVNRHPSPMGVPVMRGLGTEISGPGEVKERRQRLGSGYTSPSAFGHAGAGGQIGWADPVTGLSFAFFTNGWDMNIVEIVRRQRTLDKLVTRCVSS
jgi:CubicO group peptidase (beta-lactamase class C family)